MVVFRPYGHIYYGFGHHHHDNDAWKWLAFTAISLKILDLISEEAQRQHEQAIIEASTASVGTKILKSDGRMTEESCGSLILLKFAFPFSFRSINLILHQISLKPLLESKQTPWMPRFCISSIQTD